jgi:hypothetical protein
VTCGECTRCRFCGRGPTVAYLSVRSFEKSRLNHRFWSLPIVPFALSDRIARSIAGLSLLP